MKGKGDKSLALRNMAMGYRVHIGSWLVNVPDDIPHNCTIFAQPSSYETSQ